MKPNSARCNRSQAGFSLLELMLVLGIAAVLLLQVVPSVTHMFDLQRLRGAADSVMSQIYFARSEAITLKQPIQLSVDTSAWCVGVSNKVSCSCAIADSTNTAACTLPVGAGLKTSRLTDDQFPGVTVSLTGFNGGSTASFGAVRGRSVPGTVRLLGGNSKELRVNVGSVGQLSLCTPSGAVVAGYDLC